MKIGILQTGRPPPALQDKHGNYDDAFMRLLGGRGFEFSSWAVLDGDLPQSINEADGWLVTGSRFGVYEDHEWIAPLESFLRAAYHSHVPIAGICFGHQILAQALGGKVEKFSGGWSVGRVEYTMDGLDEPLPLYAWHQDQVVELPPDAQVTGSTAFCRYAALSYGDRAYTVQPHPEFSADFMQELITARSNVLPQDIFTAARTSMTQGQTNSAVIADRIAEFFYRKRAT